MANDAMREHWASSGAGWVENEAIFDAVFAPVTATILATAELGADRRALDVGCGSGTLLEAAVAAGADAVGVDISPVMVEAAQLRVPEATVCVADAQTVDLLGAAPGPPFDRVVSRFGVMFFADPVAAFRNIRTATAPGARLVVACWRGRDENPMFTLGTDALVARLDPQPTPPPDAPGPLAFADPGRVRSILDDSGWAQVDVQPFDFVCDYGIDGGDGVEARLATVLATTTGRHARAHLEPELGPDGWAALVDEVRAELRSTIADGGAVSFPGAIWLVTARS